MIIFIPTGRAINPVTGANWEGTGVEPDIKVDADKALKVALKEAGKAAQAFRDRELALIRDLAGQLDQAENMLNENKGSEAAALVKATLKIAVNKDFLNEPMINQLGYTYMGQEALDMAIAVFAFNVHQYPNSSNTYDSLGEAYMNQGNHKLAIKNYRKSLAMDPGNDNAKEMLRRMGVKKVP